MGDATLILLTPTFIVFCLVSMLIFLSRNLIIVRLKNAVKHDYQKQLKEFENALTTRTQIEIAKLNNRLTMEVEVVKTKIGPYADKQFELYNELWTSLWDLKYSMYQLWERASKDKFDDFSRKLEETTIKLEKSALIVEEHHYAELIGILNEFSTYEMGKRTLIEYRNQSPQAQYDPRLIKKMINDNRAVRDRLVQYLPQMMKCMRRQINGQSATAPISMKEIV